MHAFRSPTHSYNKSRRILACTTSSWTRARVYTYLLILRAVAARGAHLDEDGERRRRLLAHGGGGRGQAALHGGAHVVETIGPRHNNRPFSCFLLDRQQRSAHARRLPITLERHLHEDSRQTKLTRASGSIGRRGGVCCRVKRRRRRWRRRQRNKERETATTGIGEGTNNKTKGVGQGKRAEGEKRRKLLAAR